MLRASPSYFLRENHQGETKPGHGAESRAQAGCPQLTALGDARSRCKWTWNPSKYPPAPSECWKPPSSHPLPLTAVILQRPEETKVQPGRTRAGQEPDAPGPASVGPPGLSVEWAGVWTKMGLWGAAGSPKRPRQLMPLRWASLHSAGEVEMSPCLEGCWGDASDRYPAPPGAEQPQSLGLYPLPFLSGTGILSSMKLFYKWFQKRVSFS